MLNSAPLRFRFQFKLCLLSAHSASTIVLHPIGVCVCVAHFVVLSGAWCSRSALLPIDFRIEFSVEGEALCVFYQLECNVCKIDDGKYANKMCPIPAAIVCTKQHCQSTVDSRPSAVPATIAI